MGHASLHARRVFAGQVSPLRMTGRIVFGVAFVVSVGSAFAWEEIGDRESVILNSDGSIELKASKPVTAGVLSEEITLPKEADAVLIECRLSRAGVRSVTFSTHNAKTGDTLGYWQNPVPTEGWAPASTVLNVGKDIGKIRLFVGTDGQASQAKVEKIRWRPVRSGFKLHGAIYGAVISGTHTVRQSFKASGKKLEAIVIRIRRLSDVAKGPDLRVRLYEWKDGIHETVRQAPIAETIVPAGRIRGPLGGRTSSLVLASTYISGETELAVSLPAETRPGNTYVLELSVAGRQEDDKAFMTFCWLDCYRDGRLYDNANPRQWDLYLEVYYHAEN